MCRLLAAKAEGPEAIRELQALLPAFVEAARHDPRLKNYLGQTSHCDGYGYALAADRGRGWELYYVRGDAGPGGDACRRNLEGLEAEARRLSTLLSGSRRAFLVLHARRASRRMPRGPLNAHPFSARLLSGEGGELFLAHNGSVDCESLESELGLHGRLTDSHLLALWIAREMERGLGPLDALREGSRYVRSAYVVALLVVRGAGEEPGIYYSNVLGRGLRREAVAYYRAFKAETGGLTVLASPTIKDYNPDLPWEKAPSYGVL